MCNNAHKIEGMVSRSATIILPILQLLVEGPATGQTSGLQFVPAAGPSTA